VTTTHKRRFPKLLALAAALLALAGWIFLKPMFEPRYRGKPVSYWFLDYCRSSQQMIYDAARNDAAADALSQLGTNAVPYLVTHAFGGGPAPTKPTHLERFFGDLLRSLGLPQIVSRRMMRNEAPFVLELIKPPASQLLPLLKKHLNSHNLMERRQSLIILGTAGGEDAALVVPLLVAALHDKDVHTVRIALQSLGRLGPQAQAAVPTLLGLLNDPADTNHFAAGTAIALGKIGTSNTAPAVPFVKALFEKETDWNLRCSYAAAILRMDAAQPDALAFLTNGLMTHPSINNRWIAVQKLGEAGPAARPAIPVLLQALGRTNPLLVGYIPRTLKSLGVPAGTFLPILKQHLQTTDETILFNVAARILEIDPADDDAQQVLIALIKKESLFQDLAMDSLGQAGPSAKAALPALRQAAQQNSPPDHRARALKAIKQIETPETKPR
jgi:hypothetical protein